MEIWEPKSPGTPWDTPGLLRDCFTFTVYNLNITFSVTAPLCDSGVGCHAMLLLVFVSKCRGRERRDMAQSNGLIDILPPDWICRPNIRGMNQPPDRPHFLIKYRFHYETISRCHIALLSAFPLRRRSVWDVCHSRFLFYRPSLRLLPQFSYILVS